MSLLIKHGRIINPANNRDEILDILIEGSKISRLAKDIENNSQTVIDATDKLIMPGLVDMHVHLRQPGREDRETIASGTRAALKGGVTSMLAMANTNPAIDSTENVQLLKNIIDRDALVNVFICAAITKGRLGKELTDIAAFKRQGVIAISDDGSSVDNEQLLLEALEIAKDNAVLVICHCEDRFLSKNGMVNLGFISTRLGLRGISKESEYKRVERDVQLAAKIDAAIHITHISCKESVEIIAAAKKKGIKVTCDTCPHYFSLTEEAAAGYDTNMKINPPLRSKDDMQAIRQGLAGGIIDAIASDHAPHTENEKDIEFERAEFGSIGLETELAAAATELVDKGLLDWSGLVKKMSFNPARILAVNKGALDIGADADIIVVNPSKKWLVKKEDIVSKSKNCAFLGRTLKTVVEYAICAGKIVYIAGGRQVEACCNEIHPY